MNEKVLDIIENYEHKEQILLVNLGKKEKHPAINGSYRESEWASFFREIIPVKFSIEKNVFVIDANGNVSDEVDLAIFDEQYTPYIFKDREYQYIPIEAVAAVIQCKSTGIDGVCKWTKSIDKLRTSNDAITRIHGAISTGVDKNRKQTQTSTRPIKILCHMSNRKSPVGCFDLTLKVNNDKLTIYESIAHNNLKDWYKALNHYKIDANDDLKDSLIEEGVKLESYILKDYEVKQGEQEITIMSLIFKLNQLLMLINNPMFFPHRTYVNMFKDGFQKLLQQRKEKGEKNE